ncbi:MAG TPA: c-type cytochrome [Devosia sp.]|nr:c-type cytochrome [Devosia sp.]
MKKLQLAAIAAFVMLGSSAAFADACLDSYTKDVEPIVSKKCVSCHNDASATSGVSFTKGSGYANLVNIASEELPTMNRVTPGDSEQSYLAHKLLGTHESVGGSGTKMPPAGSLSDKDIATVVAWINGCAATP